MSGFPPSRWSLTWGRGVVDFEGRPFAVLEVEEFYRLPPIGGGWSTRCLALLSVMGRWLGTGLAKGTRGGLCIGF